MNNGSKDDIEEDWSSIMSESTTGFSDHETQIIRVSPSRTLSIACVPALSPLDMMNLSHGTHDATGHVIWMGAYFFIEAIARHDYMKDIFRSKRVLEIGCGSGVSGLALLKYATDEPTSILFTDSDPASLELCGNNCGRNLSSIDKRYSIAHLEWGDSLGVEKFDTVLATDVVYDISSLDPMLYTVSKVLSTNGCFVLAHVPRASLPGEARVGTAEDLECYILRQVHKYSLELKMVIRSRDICDIDNDTALNNISFREMEDGGCAILVFEKNGANLTAVGTFQ